MEKIKKLIGMLHVPALIGTPSNALSFEKILDHVLQEADIYIEQGINTFIVENMGDVPYLNRSVGPEIVASMSIITYEIKKRFDAEVGIQILAGCNKEALACALTSGASFIRAEAYVFAHIADEGFMDGCAGELLRYRKQIGAENVKIFADIKKKHSAHVITSDVSIEETAKAAQFFEVDGVIVTGGATGVPADLNELKSVKNSVSIPVLVGSGINLQNLHKYLKYADGLIIGSYFKENGYWKNQLSKDRISAIYQEFQKAIR